MFCWKVDPCALREPVPHAGALLAAAGALEAAPDAAVDAAVDAAAAVAGAATAAELAPDGGGAALVGELVLLSLVPHAAAANNAPAVSRVAAMREVLTK
jgi:hypothetical protein